MSDHEVTEHVKKMQAEYGDAIRIWGWTGASAWETVIGIFYAMGWTPPTNDGGDDAD